MIKKSIVMILVFSECDERIFYWFNAPEAFVFKWQRLSVFVEYVITQDITSMTHCRVWLVEVNDTLLCDGNSSSCAMYEIVLCTNRGNRRYRQTSGY